METNDRLLLPYHVVILGKQLRKSCCGHMMNNPTVSVKIETVLTRTRDSRFVK